MLFPTPFYYHFDDNIAIDFFPHCLIIMLHIQKYCGKQINSVSVFHFSMPVLDICYFLLFIWFHLN